MRGGFRAYVPEQPMPTGGAQGLGIAVGTMQAAVELSHVHESYRCQIEELQRKLKQCERVQAERDRLATYVERIEQFIENGFYMDPQPWECE